MSYSETSQFCHPGPGPIWSIEKSTPEHDDVSNMNSKLIEVPTAMR